MEKIISKYVCPSRGFKNEASFTTRFGKNISNEGGFFHKISDESRDLKPFDAICSLLGNVYAIEFKYVRQNSCHPYKLLRGSSPSKPGAQVEGLGSFSNNGGISLIIVYSANKNSYVVVDFAEVDLNTKIIF